MMSEFERFASKKARDKAVDNGLFESDFEGKEPITTAMVNKKLIPSAHKSSFFNGSNSQQAQYAGSIITDAHSRRIKAGNNLENDIGDDIAKHSTFHYYNNNYIDDTEIKYPCVITKCKFSKIQYDKYDLICKNKKEVEVDMVIIHSDTSNSQIRVYIVEVKNGCDFDTKKSKGEVQSLEATKTLCEKMGFSQVECCICCFDAIQHSDIKLKTTMGYVKTVLYEQLAEICGLNGPESRNRINQKNQLRASENLQNFHTMLTKYLSKFTNYFSKYTERIEELQAKNTALTQKCKQLQEQIAHLENQTETPVQGS